VPEEARRTLGAEDGFMYFNPRSRGHAFRRTRPSSAVFTVFAAPSYSRGAWKTLHNARLPRPPTAACPTHMQDLFLSLGVRALFAAALATLRLLRAPLLAATSFEAAYKALKSLHELALDCDAFVRLNGPPRPNALL